MKWDGMYQKKLGLHTLESNLKVEFVLPPTLAFLRKAEIIRRRSNLMKFQKNLKKWMENPSGPGALFESIAQMTSTISFFSEWFQ